MDAPNIRPFGGLNSPATSNCRKEIITEVVPFDSWYDIENWFSIVDCPVAFFNQRRMWNATECCPLRPAALPPSPLSPNYTSNLLLSRLGDIDRSPLTRFFFINIYTENISRCEMNTRIRDGRGGKPRWIITWKHIKSLSWVTRRGVEWVVKEGQSIYLLSFECFGWANPESLTDQSKHMLISPHM